jgi:hypothetical protein
LASADILKLVSVVVVCDCLGTDYEEIALRLVLGLRGGFRGCGVAERGLYVDL